MEILRASRGGGVVGWGCMPTLADSVERRRGAWGGECEHGTRDLVVVGRCGVDCCAMNTNPMVSYLVQQVLWQSPVLLAYVIGMVVCAVRARRAPAAAVMAIVGLGLMLLA